MTKVRSYILVEFIDLFFILFKIVLFLVKYFIFLTKSFILLDFILKPFNLSLIISLAPFLLKVITGTPDDNDSINVIPNDSILARFI